MLPELGHLKFYADELIAIPAKFKTVKLTASLLENDNGHPAEAAVLWDTGASATFVPIIQFWEENNGSGFALSTKYATIVRGWENIKRVALYLPSNSYTTNVFVMYAA